MPAYTRGHLRENLTFVKATSAPLYYGFATKDFAGIAGLGIAAADLLALGHTAANNLVAGTLKTLGSRSPKPPECEKVSIGTLVLISKGALPLFAVMILLEQPRVRAGVWRFLAEG